MNREWIRCTPLWNYVELFWNSLDNAPISIVFYLEMNVEVEVCVQEIWSRFTPRIALYGISESLLTYIIIIKKLFLRLL